MERWKCSKGARRADALRAFEAIEEIGSKAADEHCFGIMKLSTVLQVSFGDVFYCKCELQMVKCCQVGYR